MYFDMMPKMLLNLYGKPTTFKAVTDITTRAAASSEIRNNLFLYDFYKVKDHETPEIIADKVYRDPQLHWVILLCNDIINPMYDWVMPYEVLVDHVKDTYGEENMYSTHHYEDASGNWCSQNTPNAARITNMEYEDRINEEKRNIRILQPKYIKSFVSEVEQKLKQQIL